MVNLTKDLALWFQLHKCSQWDWPKWVNTMGYFIEHLAVGTWLRSKGLERRDEIFLCCLSTQISQLFKEPRTKEMRERFFNLHGFSLFCYHCTVNRVFFVLAKALQGRKLSQCSIVNHFLYLFGFILDLLKGYARSGFWLDFFGFTFFPYLNFDFVSLKLIN